MFLVVEGIEGAGKTTASALIEQELKTLGQEVVRTREPGGAQFSEKLRSMVLDPSYTLSAETVLLLYLAARAEHLSSIIEPALKEGKTILCDRYLDSTIAYQGIGQGLGEDLIRNLHAQLFSKRPQQGNPDAVIILLVSPEVSMARVRSRGQPLDRFEKEKHTFFEKVDRYYRGLLEKAKRGQTLLQGTTYYFVDAEQDIESVSSEIKELIRHLMHKRQKCTST